MDGIESFYQGESGRAYHQGKRGIPKSALPWVCATRARKLSPWIRPEDAVFEFGVGFGWNLAELKCRRKAGFDIGGELEENVRGLGIEFFTDVAGLPAGGFDVVLCHHVLEHLMRPATTLEEMRRLLKPDGRLLAFVPFEIERRYRRFDPREPNHHLHSWNAQTLGNLVSASGYSVRRMWIGRAGYDRFCAEWATRLRLGRTGYRWMRRMMLLLKSVREVGLLASPLS
jgi:SAM-dependent methyltransferase